MLLHAGALGRTRVMKTETARLVVGDIDPPGVHAPSEGIGRGSTALMSAALTPPGTWGGGGSAATFFWIDAKRNGAGVFMTQIMYGSPARSPFQKPWFAALEADLARMSWRAPGEAVARARCASRWRTLQKRTPIERNRHGR
jgi:CubicO group peptidase (beta-lactamase class C family)